MKGCYSMKKILKQQVDLNQDVDLSKVKKKSEGFLKEFKEFATKGNLVDMAVGVVIGGAFSKIVTSLVNDIIMPAVSILTGDVDFSNLFWVLDGGEYETLAAAQEAGAITLNYGNFITVIIDFLIIAMSMFIVIKKILVVRKKAVEEPAPAPTTKICPFCKSEIHIDATRCPHCTSEQVESV